MKTISRVKLEPNLKKILSGKIEPNPGAMQVPELGKKMEVTYNYLKHTNHSIFRKWMIENFYRAMLNELKNIKFINVLDVGCGEGFTLERLLKAELGKQFMGIDNSPVAIKLGRELFPELNLNIGNIYRLPSRNNSKDLIVCTEVLEHLEYPNYALRELIRVSKRYLLVSVPNEPIFSLRNILIGKNIKRLGSSPTHLNRWTSGQFQEFIEQDNLKILSIKHPFPFTLILAKK